jgi:hypothetical protein
VRARVVEDWLDDRIEITNRDDRDPWKSACGSAPGDGSMLGVALAAGAGRGRGAGAAAAAPPRAGLSRLTLEIDRFLPSTRARPRACMLCMHAYHVEWHMRRGLGPMLYEDDEKKALLAERSSPVTKAPRSEKAHAKEATHCTAGGLPVHSFQSLIADLGTLCLNTFVTATSPDYQITIATRPTPIASKGIRTARRPRTAADHLRQSGALYPRITKSA